MTIVYNLKIEEGINGSALLPNGSSNGNVISDLEVNDIILGTQLQPNGTQQNGFGVSNTLVDEGINQSNIDLVLEPIGPQQLGYTILANGSASFGVTGNFFIFSSSESSPTEYVILKPDADGGNFTTYKNQMMNLINGNTITSITLENLSTVSRNTTTVQLIIAQITNLGALSSYSLIRNTTLTATNTPVNFTGLEENITTNNSYLCIILTNVLDAPVYNIPVQVKATVQYA
jgi:hypothetical protein